MTRPSSRAGVGSHLSGGASVVSFAWASQWLASQGCTGSHNMLYCGERYPRYSLFSVARRYCRRSSHADACLSSAAEWQKAGHDALWCCEWMLTMSSVVARVCEGVKRSSSGLNVAVAMLASRTRGGAYGCRRRYRGMFSRRVNLLASMVLRSRSSAHARCVASRYSLSDAVAGCGCPFDGTQGGRCWRWYVLDPIPGITILRAYLVVLNAVATSFLSGRS